jgi:MinD-like ATPase involved in chromosome partitioning or flagellar assembly
MRTLLATVSGQLGRRDLALPADTPVVELLPVLVRLVGQADAGAAVAPGAWRLTRAGDGPIPSGATLAASGVLNGAVLVLERSPPGLVAPPIATPEPPDCRPPPSPPAPPSLGRRLRLVAKALAGAPPVPPGNRLGASRRQARHTWNAAGFPAAADAAVAAAPLRRPATVAVVPASAGVGATTITALLGTLLALLRHDRVLAVDARPGDGSLARILAPGRWLPVDDLRRWLGQAAADREDRLDSRLGWGPHGLMVLAAAEPARLRRLDQPAWRSVIQRLRASVDILLVDCGAGPQVPAARTAIDHADQVVLVTDADPVTASLAVEAGRSLAPTGPPVILVVNRMPSRGSRLDLQRLQQYLPAAGRPIVVPNDPDAAAVLRAGEFDWFGAPRSWRRAHRRLAAALAAGWRADGAADEPSATPAP